MKSRVDNRARPEQRRPSRAERDNRRREALDERARRLKQRAEAERRRHASVAAAYELVDRDVEVGGGIIAGALAYRFFIWLLPLALVLVAGLGIAADTASETPEQAAESLGLAGLVSHSVASAANSTARWYALGVGAVALLLATRSMLRTLIVAHRLVWTDARVAAPRPTLGATLKLLALLLGFFVVSGLVTTVRVHFGVSASSGRSPAQRRSPRSGSSPHSTSRTGTRRGHCSCPVPLSSRSESRCSIW